MQDAAATSEAEMHALPQAGDDELLLDELSRNFRFRCGAHAGAVCVGGSPVFCSLLQSSGAAALKNATLLKMPRKPPSPSGKPRPSSRIRAGSEVIVTADDGDPFS